MNALVTLIWGVEPKNPKRLSKAILQALIPVFIFGALTLATHLRMEAWDAYLIRAYPNNPLDPVTGWPRVRDFLEIEMGTVWIGLMMLVTFWSFQSRGLGNISINWPQYRVAGLSKAQLILGSASPILIGALLFLILHTMALALQIATTGGVGVNPFIERRWMIYLSAEFVLIGSVILNAALQVTTARMEERFLALWKFAAASPFLIFLLLDWHDKNAFLFGGRYILRLSAEWIVLVIIAELASWPLRILWVRRTYLRALQKLDGVEIALPE